MAGNSENADPTDPFTTLLPPNASQQQIKDYRKALDEAKKKELTEQKFHLEQATAENISHYRTRRINQQIQTGNLTRSLDFEDAPDPQRIA
jgi:site-specific recombinase XerD